MINENDVLVLELLCNSLEVKINNLPEEERENAFTLIRGLKELILSLSIDNNFAEDFYSICQQAREISGKISEITDMKLTAWSKYNEQTKEWDSQEIKQNESEAVKAP